MGKFYQGLGDELSLYVRQVAWLNAVPRREGKKNLQAVPDEEALSRLKQMEEDGIDPLMPSLPDPWLVECLMEIGPTEPAGMGAAAISWRTLFYWQTLTGIVLEPWQARLLRRLSGDWLAESDRARKVDCPAPWSGEVREISREAVARKVADAFAVLAQRQPRSGLR